MVVNDVRKVLEVISSDWCWLSASLSGPCLRRDLLNWMLATSCEQGHLDVVQLLVQSYDADAKDCAIHSDEFAVINGLPLYAAARAGRETHRNTLQTPSILVYVGDVKLRRLIDLECFCLLSIFFCFLRRCCFVFNNILFVLTVTCMMLTSFETVYLKEEFAHINVLFLCFIFSCLHTLSPILLVLDIWMGHFSACKTPYYIHLEFQKLPS